MKNGIVVCLMLITMGTTIFAKGHSNNDNYEIDNVPRHVHKMQRVKNYKRDSEKERVRIAIEEKKLDIRKELLKDTPDWNRIERLNVDIATEEAKIKTCRMRESYEKKFQEN